MTYMRHMLYLSWGGRTLLGWREVYRVDLLSPDTNDVPCKSLGLGISSAERIKWDNARHHRHVPSFLASGHMSGQKTVF